MAAYPPYAEYQERAPRGGLWSVAERFLSEVAAKAQLIHDRVPCIRQGSPATTPAGSCDLTQRFPLISDSLARLRSTSCVIDGEAVSCDANGIAAFDRIRYRRHDHTAFMYAFDLIVLLMRMPALTLARTDASVVCVPKNSIRVDHVSESPNVGDDDRAVLPLPGPVRLAVQVEEPT